ncbi:MAG: oligosaccharide flippase family protein [Clostridia bacterium]|nr:oligosaccharide flippase family protein [Clostridia bacterium]
MKTNNMMTGAIVLSIGAVLAKLFSAIYRIALTRILGGEGIGIYQLIFPLYSLCVVLATAGLPLAISKVVARHPGKEKSVLKKCLFFTSLLALVITLILLLLSKPLALIQGEESLKICYIILAPSIIIVNVISVLRGYYQGKQNYVPSAVSNIVEQFAKLLVGLMLSVMLLKISLFASIIGAIISIVISEVFALIVLLVYLKKQEKTTSGNVDINLKSIAKDVLPITLTNIIMPIASFVDSLVVVNLLAKNFARPMSVFLYGIETGAVSSLVSLPTIFSFAIASVIMPNIALKNRQHNRSQSLAFALRVILIITIPCALCFLVVPNRLISLLYSDGLNGLGVQGLNIAFRLLAFSSVGVVFLAINQIYTSSLQAVDERFVTIRNLSIGVLIKFLIEIAFLPSKYLNIFALTIANTACHLTAMVLNHFEIQQHFKIYFDFVFTGKLVIANGLMVLSLICVLALSQSWVVTIIGVLVAVIVYLYSLYMLKIFNKKDLAIIKYKV